MSKPDMTSISRFPDLEKPGRERLNQLLRLFILTTRGDILTRGATYLKRLALGAAGTVLHSDGTDAEWAVLKASEVEVEELSTATYDDVQDFINFFGDRTILSGGTITAHGDADGKVVIAACTAWCKVTDSTTAIGKFFDYAGKVSQTLTDLSANFIYLDYNGGTPQVVVATALLTYSLKLDHILLGVVFRNGTATHIHNAEHIGISGVGRSNLHWLEHFLVHRVAGAVTSEAGTRQLAVTAGVVYAGLSRNATNAFNTNNSDTFSYWYYDGDAGPAAWVEVTGQTVISNTQYNALATGLVNLSAAAKRGVHWVYLDNDGVHLHVVYGQGDYSTAEAELAAVPALLPPLVTNYCVLIAKIIVQKDQDIMYISYPWTSAFQTSLAADHGSLAGLGDDDHTKYLLADGTRELVGILATAETELTIDTDGEITVTQTRHKVDTFEDAASDDLSTINGGTTVNLIILRAEADARTVVLKHGTGNIWLQGKADVSLDDLEDGILLVWDSTNSKWFDISSGGGGLTADSVDGSHLSQDFGASGGRLVRATPFLPLDGIVLHTSGLSLSGAGPFQALINGVPTATSVVYDGEISEGFWTGMTAFSATYWGRIVLHNITAKESGTCTSDTENKIIDSVATFETNGVAVDDEIKQTTDQRVGYVKSVDSETQLSIKDASGNDYDICPDGDEAYVVMHGIRYVETVNTATNTITTSSSTDDWANNDTIDIESPLMAMGVANEFVELDLSQSTQIDANTIGIILSVVYQDKEGAADTARYMGISPYAAYNTGLVSWFYLFVASEIYSTFLPIQVNHQRICLFCTDNNESVRISLTVKGTYEYADT